MKIKHINEFPFSKKKKRTPDLVFGVQPNGMGMSGLIMMILNDEVYLFNYQNAEDNELYRQYLLLTESYYPELIRVIGNGTQVAKRRESDSDYRDNYLGQGNYLRVKRAFAFKYGIINQDYSSFAKFLNKNLIDCLDLYEESLKINIPSKLLIEYENIKEIIRGLNKLKENNFKCENGDELDLNKFVVDSTQHRMSIDFEKHEISLIPNESEDMNIMYFSTKTENIEKLIDLHLEYYERKLNK